MAFAYRRERSSERRQIKMKIKRAACSRVKGQRLVAFQHRSQSPEASSPLKLINSSTHKLKEAEEELSILDY
jgi:hypothetical protein